MSLIGVVLNVLLIALVLAALFVGWRLNRKLNALRSSQEGFVKAVAELDQAAMRAELGLDTLRRTTHEAQSDLTERLDEAHELVRRLERITAAGQGGRDAARGAERRVEPRSDFSRSEPPRADASRAERAPAPTPRPAAPRPVSPFADAGPRGEDLFDEPADLAAALRELRRRRGLPE